MPWQSGIRYFMSDEHSYNDIPMVYVSIKYFVPAQRIFWICIVPVVLLPSIIVVSTAEEKETSNSNLHDDINSQSCQQPVAGCQHPISKLGTICLPTNLGYCILLWRPY